MRIRRPMKAGRRVGLVYRGRPHGLEARQPGAPRRRRPGGPAARRRRGGVRAGPRRLVRGDDQGGADVRVDRRVGRRGRAGGLALSGPRDRLVRGPLVAADLGLPHPGQRREAPRGAGGRSVPFSSLAPQRAGPTVDAAWFQGPDEPYPGHWRTFRQRGPTRPCCARRCARSWGVSSRRYLRSSRPSSRSATSRAAARRRPASSWG